VRTRPIVIVALLTAVAAVAACSARSNAGSTSTSAQAPATTTAATTTSAATPTTAAAAAWPTGPRSGPATGGGELVAIRTANHGSFDRVVFQFNGEGHPAYRVRYVPQVTEDPSDRPVPLQGRAFLLVAFQGASTMDVNGQRVYQGPTTVTPGYPTLKQVKLAGDFERVLSFGIGVDHKTGFRVLPLTNRIAIDLAR
jgi:hypothetical protein